MKRLLRLARYWRPALVATLWLSPVLALAAGLIATTHFVDETPFTLSELITTTIVFLAGAIYGGTLLLERDEFEAERGATPRRHATVATRAFEARKPAGRV